MGSLVVDERTEDFLLRQLVSLRPSREPLGRRLGAGRGTDPLAPVDGVLDALPAAGAISGDEARLWRPRFGGASTGNAADPVGDDVRERADAYVARLPAALPVESEDAARGVHRARGCARRLA